MNHEKFSCSQLFSVLGESTRLQVLKLLLTSKMSASQIGSELKIEKSLLSKHLNVLLEHGFVKSEKQGRSVFYEILPHIRSNVENQISLYCCDITLHESRSQNK